MRNFAVLCIVHDNINPSMIYQLQYNETNRVGLPGGLLQPKESLSDACIRILLDDMQIKAEVQDLWYVETLDINNIPTTVYRITRHETVTDSIVLSSNYNDITQVPYMHLPSMHSAGLEYVDGHDIVLSNYNHRMATDHGFEIPAIRGVHKIVVKQTKPKDVPMKQFEYEVCIHFSSGDCDAYEEVQLDVPTCNLTEFISHYHSVAVISQSHLIHKPIRSWPRWAQEVYNCSKFGHWPIDIISNGDYAAAYYYMEAWYYDGNGDKFECEVIA